MSLSPGTQLGTYEIVGRLGAGGMGEVYRARDLRLGREVALKVLPADVAANPDRLARFEREARTVAGLNHPNIVTLYSVEDEDDVPYLTMELVEGESLAALVSPGGLPAVRVLDIGIPLTEALSAAHGRGVVHRDLKPSNVMLTREGWVKVLDFGLAKLSLPSTDTDPDLTQAVTAAPISLVGEIVGTVPYMAPEQIRGEAVDARTDLFALGIVLYELATGRRPFRGETPADVSSSILRDAPEPLTRVRSDLPPDLDRIVARCLQKNPRQRAQSATEVRDELRRLRQALEHGMLPDAGYNAESAGPSVAVLPFVNRSRDEEDEYFADGITEAVIAQLCKARTLRVISRSSVMPFKNRDVDVNDIANQLHVGNLLEGSVRRVGDRVRIVAQLVDARSGQSVWAETYDRRLTDIFEIQTDVALQIATALKAELSPEERSRIRREPTRNVEAYELYLRARHLYVSFTAEGMRRSIDYFERAVARDPDFALAWAGLATVYAELGEISVLTREQAGTKAKAAAARAIEIDPDLGEAHSANAYVRLAYEFDWAGAEAGFRRALELSPNNADANDLFGRMCAGAGRYEEAILYTKRAFELDPLTHQADLANAYLRAGRHEEAVAAARRGLELHPHSSRLLATLGWGLLLAGRQGEGLERLEAAVRLTPNEDMWLAQLGQAYAMAGREKEARRILEQLEDPNRPVAASPYHLAYVYTGLGGIERALDCLERAFQEGSGPLFAIKGSFLLAPLRDHPRFQALLKRIRLA